MHLIDTIIRLPRLLAMPPTTPTVVVVVDDDISVRESLELLIQNQGWQPALFESAQEFLARLPTVAPSCLILDVNLPDLSGLDIQQRISDEKSSTPIIFITGYGDVPTSVRAMKAGAAEFLTKPLDDEILIAAIREAVLRSQANLKREGAQRQLQDRFGLLSKREREVMNLVVKGLMNKQVGFELGISEITVKAHRGKVMEKMHATTFVDLVNMAGRLGISTAREA
jgi:FixJ family two-component response regulator